MTFTRGKSSGFTVEFSWPAVGNHSELVCTKDNQNNILQTLLNCCVRWVVFSIKILRNRWSINLRNLDQKSIYQIQNNCFQLPRWSYNCFQVLVYVLLMLANPAHTQVDLALQIANDDHFFNFLLFKWQELLVLFTPINVVRF